MFGFGFVVGLIVGGSVGLAITALCIASRDDDSHSDSVD